MKTVGYDQPLYILPFDPRGSFETKRFDWHGDLTPEQDDHARGRRGGDRAPLSGIRRHFREGPDR